jgi:transcriptional regulator with XRE-family HTH domain
MKVKKKREEKGMNQKELANASGITQATISRIESGQVRELKSGALKRLASALGVTVDFLVGKTERLTPEDIVSSDADAKYLLRGYEKLSGADRKLLKDYLRYLEDREKRSRKR